MSIRVGPVVSVVGSVYNAKGSGESMKAIKRIAWALRDGPHVRLQGSRDGKHPLSTDPFADTEPPDPPEVHGTRIPTISTRAPSRRDTLSCSDVCSASTARTL
jgi:hypothetical protein